MPRGPRPEVGPELRPASPDQRALLVHADNAHAHTHTHPHTHTHTCTVCNAGVPYILPCILPCSHTMHHPIPYTLPTSLSNTCPRSFSSPGFPPQAHTYALPAKRRSFSYNYTRALTIPYIRTLLENSFHSIFISGMELISRCIMDKLTLV